LLWLTFLKAAPMDKQQEFEMLKERMLTSYSDYMDAVRKTSFDDLEDVDIRINLMGTYTKSVLNNIAYRDFLHKYKQIKSK